MNEAIAGSRLEHVTSHSRRPHPRWALCYPERRLLNLNDGHNLESSSDGSLSRAPRHTFEPVDSFAGEKKDDT